MFMLILQNELNEFLMIWNSRNVRLIFHFPGKVSSQYQGIGPEWGDIDVVEDVLGVNSLPLFRNNE